MAQSTTTKVIPAEANSMSRFLRCLVSLMLGIAFVGLPAGAQSRKEESNKDYSQQAWVVENDITRVTFQNDGTDTREVEGKIRVQSEAGVQQLGVLKFAFENSFQALDIDYVRVRKPDGAVVQTPMANVQDMPSEVTREAPLYSDLRQKHVAVKGLRPGDVLEYNVQWHTLKPLAAGQFWFAFNFSHNNIVLQQLVEIHVPRTRGVKYKSTVTPTIRDDGESRVFSWSSSNLEEKSKKNDELIELAARGQLPSPDVLMSSFQSWEEVGGWYEHLQRDRVQPTPEIQAKAEELTRGAVGSASKIRAIYNFVSTRFRYVGLDFGVGRYQPHVASEVMANGYGDCKDKHTLLTALLAASGIKAYPALINSGHVVDQDVPTPGQFDHVITVVPQEKENIWLDTTPEVAPFEYLVRALRDKPALVISSESPSRFVTTPAQPPYEMEKKFTMAAKLDESGTLEGDVEQTQRGDAEVLLRSAFRRTPQSQWKDLVQGISYATGFAGTVSEVNVTSPEATEAPLQYKYHYHRQDYPDWKNRRIKSPALPLILPALPNDDTKPQHAIYLAERGEILSETRVELPKGYTPELPKGVELVEEFAEYHASYAWEKGAVVSKLRFVIKQQEVPVKQLVQYESFRKRVEDDRDRYIQLESKQGQAGAEERAAQSYWDQVWNLPDTESSKAARFEEDAQGAFGRKDNDAAISSYKDAVREDPKFTRGWVVLGAIYMDLNRAEQALECYRKAKNVSPNEPVVYRSIGMALMSLRRADEAIETWEEMLKIAPEDQEAAVSLGSILLDKKRYDEAATVLESALKRNPESTILLARVASAYVRSNHMDQGFDAFQKLIRLDPSADNKNTAAWELAEVHAKLPEALEYAQAAVREEEEASQKVRLENLTPDDLKRVERIGNYWDTLGRVHFLLGNYDQAEQWLDAAWKLTQYGATADHLAGCGKTPTEPRMILVSTTQPDKKKVCVEKMSSSWMCSAT